MKTNKDIVLDVRDLTMLSAAEIAALGQLSVSAWQEIKGGSFSESVEAWQEGPKNLILGLCFRSQGQPVGMTLFKRPPLSPSWASYNAATIHGLKIASPLQGKGLGHQAFNLAVQSLRETWSDVSELMLGVDADNAAALAVYRAYGMEDSGPIFEGQNGPENRLNLTFTTQV